jgi:recombination protein RecA
MASLKDIAKKLNREYKMDDLITVSDVKPNYERLACGALGMDYPLFGGLPLGRICVYSGLQHSGKTTAACCELAAYQRKFPDKTCVFVDVEHSLDLQFQANMNGVDLEKLYYVDPHGLSGEQICDLIVELQKSDDIGMIVLDSLPALIPQVVLENDLTKDAGMRGTMAKKLYPFLAIMQSMLAEKQNIFILINQVRDDGKTFTGIQKWKEPGGGAPAFYSSVSVRFGTRKFTLGDDMDACGSKNGEGADGFRLHFKIMKNKTAPCNRGGGFITYRYASGMDWLNDLLEIATGFNFIQRLNNVTYQLVNLETGETYKTEDGQELKGKKADLIEYIKTNITFQNEYLAMLNKYISSNEKSYGSLLDERANAEINEQERLVAEQTSYNDNGNN